jgi:hypothetical protein
MIQKIFTKDEVVFLLKEILESPDLVTDLIDNENSDYSAEDLLRTSINNCDKTELQKGQSLVNDLVLIASVQGKTAEGRFCRNIAKMSISDL